MLPADQPNGDVSGTWNLETGGGDFVGGTYTGNITNNAFTLNMTAVPSMGVGFWKRSLLREKPWAAVS